MAGVLLAPLLVNALLGALGFSSIGPVAGNVDPFKQRHRLIELIFVPATLLCYWMLGSFAAGIQSAMGNVPAGSLFAIAQSTAMGGGGVGVVGLVAALF